MRVATQGVGTSGLTRRLQLAKSYLPGATVWPGGRFAHADTSPKIFDGGGPTAFSTLGSSIQGLLRTPGRTAFGCQRRDCLPVLSVRPARAPTGYVPTRIRASSRKHARRRWSSARPED